jgi:hypothetical protein
VIARYLIATAPPRAGRRSDPAHRGIDRPFRPPVKLCTRAIENTAARAIHHAAEAEIATATAATN